MQKIHNAKMNKMKKLTIILITVILIAVFLWIRIASNRPIDGISGATIQVNGNSMYHSSEGFKMKAGSLEVMGEVASPGMVSLEKLYMHEVVIKESKVINDSVVFIGAYRYTGYSLLDILNPFLLQKKNAEQFRPVIDTYVEIENASGERIVFSWSEIFHTNNLHQVLIATGGSQVNPHKKTVDYPKDTDWKIVASGDLRNSRQLVNPTKITVRSFDRKEYAIQRNMKPLHSPSIKIVIEDGQTAQIDNNHGKDMRTYETLFYGMGMGYHPSGSFRGPALDEVLKGSVTIDDELLRTGLLCFVSVDGYRSIFSCSELFNRTDQVSPILDESNDESDGGRFRIFLPSDFFADRSVKALKEIYIFRVK